MEDKTYNTWDVIVKVLGFLATAVSIYLGIYQFGKQEKDAANLELKKNFWTSQNQVYSDICKNAGAMVANLGDTKAFSTEKVKFLSAYYGQMVLVEDPKVDSNMRELQSYLQIFNPLDSNKVFTFKKKVLHLSEACRKSSATYKQEYLE